MKIIHESSIDTINNITDAEKFLFVLKEMKSDEITTQFIEKISERFSKIRKNCEETITECIKITSSTGSKGVKRFDIMKSDGSIEIGLEAKDSETLKQMFNMTGECIQILREINEYGIIVKENAPHHCEQPPHVDTSSLINSRELYNVLHPNKTNVKLKDIKDKYKPEFVKIEEEYEKFQNNPDGYKDSTEKSVDSGNTNEKVEPKDSDDKYDKTDKLLNDWVKSLTKKTKNTKRRISKATKTKKSKK